MMKTEEEVDVLKGLPNDIAPELAILLHTYRAVFDTLVGLPPQRKQNHAIPLKEGSNPIKVKPYRYPYSQKEQIMHFEPQLLLKDIDEKLCKFINMHITQTVEE